MSDPAKSQATFSFTSPTTSVAPGLFGSQPSSSQPQNALFGSKDNPATTSGAGIFGGTSTAGGGSLFGSGGTGIGANSVFGQKSGGENPGVGLSFGQSLTNQPQQSVSSPFASFSTPSKPSDSAGSSAGQTSNLFGQIPGNTGSNLFQSTSNPGPSAPGPSSTPTTKPGTGISFFGSTTPAGPPPSSSVGTKGPPSLGPPATGQGSTGWSFGSSQPPESSTGALTSQAQGSSLQSTAIPSGGGGIFGDVGKSQGTSATAPAASTGAPTLFPTLTTQTPGTSKPPPLFSPVSASGNGSNSSGNPAGTFNFLKPQPTTSTASEKPSTAAPSGVFSNLNTKSTSEAPGSSSATSSNTLFGNLVSQKAPKGSTAASSAPSGGPFASVGTGQQAGSKGTATTTGQTQGPSLSSLFSNSASAATSGTAQGGQAQSSEPGPTPSIFGSIGNNAASSAPSQSSQTATAGLTDSTKVDGTATLGASTSGPLPAAQSRLKNKSMDEIITRWASDLSKYQKEFQKQSEKVAAWDRLLMDNSETIQKLYGNTLEAERATAEVERQITAVENDQVELEVFLDRYETEVDRMISSQVGPGDSHIGPDSERERTYHLAERLTDRLDEMGKDLTSMIDEINDASSSLNKNSRADDPLSQVVKVLNNHLTQLQSIDQGTAALQLKVSSAQRASQSLGTTSGLGGPNSDAADGFYRSFMGRR